MIKRIATLFFLLAFALAGATAAMAESPARNKVKQISLEELAEIMSDPDTPGMFVAMASWCGPCRREMPTIDRLYGKYSGNDITIAGLSVDSGGSQAFQSLVDAQKVAFPVYWIGETGGRRLRVSAIPTILLIRNGKIVDRMTGVYSEQQLDRVLRSFLE